MANITIKKISGALGAEISGIDLNQKLSSEEIHSIKQAFLDHQVIFLRNQDIQFCSLNR